MPPDMVDKINLSFGRLIGLGRSAEYPEEHLISGLDPFDVGPCAEIVNRPVIYPDGDLQSCCCAGVAEFTVGNLRTESLAALFARMRARSHYRFINAFGPKRCTRPCVRSNPAESGQEATPRSAMSVSRQRPACRRIVSTEPWRPGR